MLFTRRFTILAPSSDAGSAGASNPVIQQAEHALAAWKLVQAKLPDIDAAVAAVKAYHQAHLAEISAINARIEDLKANDPETLEGFMFDGFDLVDEVAGLRDDISAAHPSAQANPDLTAAFAALRS